MSVSADDRHLPGVDLPAGEPLIVLPATAVRRRSRRRLPAVVYWRRRIAVATVLLSSGAAAGMVAASALEGDRGTAPSLSSGTNDAAADAGVGVDEPARHVRTSAPPADDAPPAGVAPAWVPLRIGSHGDAVVDLQDRLRQLGFEPGPSDGQFGTLTKQAVWAFEKLVIGTPRAEVTGVVTEELWQAIETAEPIRPRRSHAAGETTRNHTEVYLPEQVVVFFVDDGAALISHMSSGSGEHWRETVTIQPGAYRNEHGTEPRRLGMMGHSLTPGGVYIYDRMIDGNREAALGTLYDPAYFNGGIAVHGANSVPLKPSSHGCIRIPRYISSRFQQYVALGDQVLVWDGEHEPEALGAVKPPVDRIDPDWTG